MSQALDLVGKIFGKLTVARRVENGKHGKAQWLCICACGKENIVGSSALTSGNTKSCGCVHFYKRKKDLIGKVFGHLTVIKKVDDDSRFLCSCACGGERITTYAMLTKGLIDNCKKCLINIKKIDLTGMVFGRLTVIRDVECSKSGDEQYLCHCLCGRDKIISAGSLRAGTKSCGCLKKAMKNGGMFKKGSPGYILRGTDHPKWRGGRMISGGYANVWVPEKKRYVGEHRIVMENKIGRKLSPNEIVHHKNGDRQDNRIENLELCTKSTHFKGQRIEDKIKDAIDFLNSYGYTVNIPSDKKEVVL